MITIEVIEIYQKELETAVLLEAAQKTLQEGAEDPEASLSIRITDQLEMRTLNKQFREEDQSTDVLSFSADFFDPDLGSRYLGDVVISYPEAAAQAAARGHSLSAELQLLVVHGVLHLLGHDHGTPEEKKAMWGLQERVLGLLGLEIEVGED